MNEFRSGERYLLAAMYTTNKAPTTITPTVTAFMVSPSLTVVSTRPIRHKATQFGINEVLKLLAVYSRISAGQIVDSVVPFGRPRTMINTFADVRLQPTTAGGVAGGLRKGTGQ